MLKQYKSEIICLQETNLKDDKVQALSQYQKICKHRNGSQRANGGVAILTSNTIEAQEIPLQSNLEAIAFKIHDTNDIHICIIYFPPVFQLHEQYFNDALKQIPQPRIIVGDFNAHNSNWGSSSLNTKGKIIKQTTDWHNLVILNDGRPTRFNIQTGDSSYIDLSICDPTLLPLLTWDRLDYTYNSDNYPIIIYNNSNSSSASRIAPAWNLKNGDWDLFSSLIEDKIEYCTVSSDIDESLKHFTNMIIDSATN